MIDLSYYCFRINKKRDDPYELNAENLRLFYKYSAALAKGAVPLTDNKYKVLIAKTLVKRAILD